MGKTLAWEQQGVCGLKWTSGLGTRERSVERSCTASGTVWVLSTAVPPSGQVTAGTVPWAELAARRGELSHLGRVGRLMHGRGNIRRVRSVALLGSLLCMPMKNSLVRCSSVCRMSQEFLSLLWPAAAQVGRVWKRVTQVWLLGGFPALGGVIITTQPS